MSEQTGQKKITVQTLKESLGDLRIRVSEFQESIGEYLEAVEELWGEVKSHLVSVEARLADLEVQLSTMPADTEWQLEKLDLMLQDLNEIGEGIGRMRQRFRLFTQGHQQRVN